MKFGRGFLLFSYGLFTIATQSLLFREFITTFEANDITIGLFFASWFLWIGLGALFIYKSKNFPKKLLRHIEVLFLLYIPASVLQFFLIIHAREIASVAPYQLMSIRTVVLLSVLVNAPVSLVTGLFFPLACRWAEQDYKLAVSHVYLVEAAGSFFGGFGVTLLLSIGVNSVTIFFFLAFIVSAAVFCVELAKIRAQARTGMLRILPALLPPISILIFMCFGVDRNLNNFVQAVKWSKLFPAEALRGSFQTAQAEYLYGMYRGQWVVVREASTCEVLPDKASAGKIAAMVLAQNPGAKRILVVGSGLQLCYDFLNLPQTERVTWAHCDSEYIEKIEKFLPDEFRMLDDRLVLTNGDVRSALDNTGQQYDIAIINLPEATSSALNRYYSVEFYHQLRKHLAESGVLAVRVAGGENIMGTELVNLGASVKLTLEKVFAHLVLVPGEDTWFIASDSDAVTGRPGVLADNFARIENSQSVFVPQGLLSVYLPDRAEKAMESYSRTDLPQRLLINRDSYPLTCLYSLLLATKQSGSPVTKFVKHLAMAGPTVFLVPVFVFVFLRVTYIIKSRTNGPKSSFDSTFLVFSAGWLGIGVVIVLMYLYQTRFGSLYLHIGIISSVFMIGLTAGAALTRHLRLRFETLLFALIAFHVVVLAAIAGWPLGKWTHTSFATAFLLCGFCTGGYFPLAANRLSKDGFETGLAGGKLEMADHIGAAAAGLVTSLALVPVLGTKATLFIFIVSIMSNVPAEMLRIYRPQRTPSAAEPTLNSRRLGYILFGVAASVVICSNLLAAAGRNLRLNLPEYAAKILAGDKYIERASASLTSGKKIDYYKVYETKDELDGYIFSSQDLAPQVRGFGGKMNLAVRVDAQGRLIDFNILQSNETPSYIELLSKWYDNLKQRTLFESHPFTGIDAVTGATVSSEAVLSSLELAGQNFAGEVLKQTVKDNVGLQTRRAAYLPDPAATYLITAVALTLIVVYRGQSWSRLAVLAFNLVVGGIVLNAQYSTEQIATLLSLQIPNPALTGTFLLTVVVPFISLFVGNIYCGYMCPFGALQDLVSYIFPAERKELPSREKMQKYRLVKYILLFVLMIFYFVSRSRETLSSDLLIKIFNFRFLNVHSLIYTIVVLALVGSLFYPRFWCRYLCPAGAFLSLFNNYVLMKRYVPPKHFSKCEFGLTANNNMDCIYCDRCRYTPRTIPQRARGYRIHLSKYFALSVLVVSVFVFAASVNEFTKAFPAGTEYTAASTASAGRARDVNLQQIRTMIKEKKLSDHEAEYYEKAE
jgi:spermidine synthase